MKTTSSWNFEEGATFFYDINLKEIKKNNGKHKLIELIKIPN